LTDLKKIKKIKVPSSRKRAITRDI